MEELNKLLEDFINHYDIKDIREVIFTSNLSTIIDRYPINFKYNGFKNKIELGRSISITRSFLEELSLDYASTFNQIKEDIDFVKIKADEFAYCDYINGRPYIFLPYSNTLKDVYALTHEIIHATTVMDSEESVTRNIFCEVPAVCSEMLLKDYLKNNGIKEYGINDIRDIVSVKYYNKINMFQTMLISEFLDKGIITPSNFMNMLKKFNLKDSIEIAQHISENIRENDFDIFFLNRYVIGYTFACYLYDNFSIEEFVELNNSINSFEITDFLDYLNLDYKDDMYLDLTPDSYDKIEKSYKKRLKKIG